MFEGLNFFYEIKLFLEQNPFWIFVSLPLFLIFISISDKLKKIKLNRRLDSLIHRYEKEKEDEKNKDSQNKDGNEESRELIKAYRVLGVRIGAGREKIVQSYRKLVKQYHPDLCPGKPEEAMAIQKIEEINQAYHILKKRIHF